MFRRGFIQGLFGVAAVPAIPAVAIDHATESRDMDLVARLQAVEDRLADLNRRLANIEGIPVMTGDDETKTLGHITQQKNR